jgi:two-component system OmpR family response regulator
VKNNRDDKPTRVLVVDDNKDVAVSMGRFLKALGYEVKTCFDGPTALATADQFEPDACVLDINMPGMDGYELAHRLRQQAPDRPPVLATVTAFEGFGHLARASESGFDLHFTKPVDPWEVAGQIAHCLRNSA